MKTIAQTLKVDVRRSAADTTQALERHSRARLEFDAASWSLENRYAVLMSAVADLFAKAVPPEDVIGVVTALFAAHRTIEEQSRHDAVIFRDNCNASAVSRAQ